MKKNVVFATTTDTEALKKKYEDELLNVQKKYRTELIEIERNFGTMFYKDERSEGCLITDGFASIDPCTEPSFKGMLSFLDEYAPADAGDNWKVYTKNGKVTKAAERFYNDCAKEAYAYIKLFMRRKSVKKLQEQYKALQKEYIEVRNNTSALWKEKIEKAKKIQSISADFKDESEFIKEIKNRAKKLGFYANMSNVTYHKSWPVTFHESFKDGSHSVSICASANFTVPKGCRETIIYTTEMVDKIMEPLKAYISADHSWEKKYEDKIYIRKLKREVTLHVAVGNNRYKHVPFARLKLEDFNEKNVLAAMKKMK